MRIVVTGADGFVGQHVVAHAIGAGHDVHAIHRSAQGALRAGPATVSTGDLTKEWPVAAAPDGIIHLASLAAVGPSFDAPQDYISANTSMLTRMAEALLAQGPTPTRIVVVSTGSLYASGIGPCDESRPLAMTSPYAVSKAAVELQCEYYRSRGLDIVIARPFNHIGPGQSRGFLVPDLVHSLASIGPSEPLVVGNLDTRRDYTDVRDVARAYVDLLEAPHVSPLYNIAAGRSVSGREILGSVCAALDRDVPETVIDPARLRPNDPQEIVGDASRLRRELEWAPRIGFDESISDFVAARTRAISSEHG